MATGTTGGSGGPGAALADAGCDACATASARYEATGRAVVCACGRAYAPDDFRWPTEPLPPARGGAPVRLVTPRAWVAPTEPAAPLSPLARAGTAALALVPDDPELARVRMLLTDLRPDCPDPLKPPTAEAADPPPVVVRDTTASWGGVPRGVGFGAGCALAVEVLEARCVADVVAELAALPADARAVLRWLRAHGSLAEGLRGLYVDAGLAFASAEQSEAWRDLGARREGAPMHGRRLVLAAATAWGR